MTDVAGIYARRLPDLDVTVQLGVASGTLIQVSFPEMPAPDASPEHDLLDRIEAYVAGGHDSEDPPSFRDVEIALTVPTDQRAALQTLRRIDYGESIEAAALARMTPGIDAEADADRETVRTALRENPIPVVLPDHRVDDVVGATPSSVRDRLRSIEGIGR